MPNYSKTSIYKICCNDPNITDIYIGSTCNFTKRKYSHKNTCNNESQKSHNLKVYKFIRDSGGWNNWTMIQIKEFSCENKREKEVEERKYIEELKPTLNCYIPTRTMNEWFNDNKEKVKKQRKGFYIKNREKLKKIDQEYYIENKEKVNSWCKEYYIKNREDILQKKKEYQLKNKDEISKKRKERYLKKKESMR